MFAEIQETSQKVFCNCQKVFVTLILGLSSSTILVSNLIFKKADTVIDIPVL